MLLALAGCQAKVAGDGPDPAGPRPVTIAELTVKGASDLPDDAHDALKAQVRTALAEALGDDGPIVLSDGSTDREAPGKVRGELRFELITDPERDSPNVVLHATVDLSGKDASGPLRLVGEAWSALEPDTGEAPEALRARAARVACQEVARQLARQARVIVADEAALESLLASDDTLQLGHAIHEVARRRATRLVPAVRGLLFHPDKDVVIAALAALGELRAQDSVTAISDLVTSPDMDKVEHAIYALASIASSDAIEMLEALAAKHPEPGVRQLAREQLQRLAAHRDR